MRRLLTCGFANSARLRRAAHFVNRAKRKKSKPARIAAVSRRVQRPEKPVQFSFSHLSLANALQFKVSASRTVRVPKGGQGHRSSIKSSLAPQAAPRPQRRNRHQPIHGSAPVRPHTIFFFSARWTIHRYASSVRGAEYTTNASTSIIPSCYSPGTLDYAFPLFLSSFSVSSPVCFCASLLLAP